MEINCLAQRSLNLANWHLHYTDIYFFVILCSLTGQITEVLRKYTVKLEDIAFLLAADVYRLVNDEAMVNLSHSESVSPWEFSYLGIPECLFFQLKFIVSVFQSLQYRTVFYFAGYSLIFILFILIFLFYSFFTTFYIEQAIFFYVIVYCHSWFYFSTRSWLTEPCWPIRGQLPSCSLI